MSRVCPGTLGRAFFTELEVGFCENGKLSAEGDSHFRDLTEETIML